MPKTNDFLLNWTRRFSKIESVHRIRLFQSATGSETLVIATESPDATGVSVTNGVEEIAEAVCAKCGLDPLNIIFIEHYERDMNDRALKEFNDRPDDFSLVKLSWNPSDKRFERPQWSPIEKAEIEKICGEIVS